MASPRLDYSCSHTYPDIHSARYPIKQRRLQSHGQAESVPSHLFGLDDFRTTALSHVNDFNDSSTMGPTKGLYEYSRRPEDPPDSTPSNRSVSCTSTATSFFSLYQNLPSQMELPVTLPVFFTNNDGQTLSLQKQFEVYAYGSLSNNVGFQGMARGSSFSPDATSFSDLASQGAGILEDVASGTLRSNGENVHDAAYPLRPVKAEPLPLCDHSYVPVGNDVLPTTDITHQWPSNIAGTSKISATTCSAPKVRSYNNVGHLGTLTSLRCRCKKSKSNGFNPPTAPSVLRPRRRRLKQKPCLSDADSSNASTSHLSGPMKPDPSDINSSDTSNTHLLAPAELPLDDFDCSQSATPCHPVRNESNLEGSEPSEASTENEADPKYLFKKYTYQDDDSSDECQVGDFDAPKAPNVSSQHTPETLKPCAVQHSKRRPVGDAGFNEKLQPQGIDYRQTVSNVLSAASEPHKKAKKPRMKKEREERPKENPNRVCKIYSSARRVYPKHLYWCAKPTCKASQDRAFCGFRTTEDTRRHLALHEPPKMFCTLAHKNGEKYEGRRTDHLREHVRHMHKDRSVDEPEIKAMIDSQRYQLPELKERVNVIAVQT